MSVYIDKIVIVMLLIIICVSSIPELEAIFIIGSITHILMINSLRIFSKVLQFFRLFKLMMIFLLFTISLLMISALTGITGIVVIGTIAMLFANISANEYVVSKQEVIYEGSRRDIRN